MASSMLTGDRRWGQTRKSGMTVLGKVPKPINLPSQRLENHGLDPNVEIVPKGTLTWGSRPSSAATNAWGTSSTLSPHADGSAGSPSFASGRPSSGGSGTRPSTAGSDRSHEPISSAWGPNSRPSSASGILASSQMSAAATRPRSADTRPGSSQLSCFAESSVDNSVARGATGTADGPGTVSSKTGGFTLSSGDFPTLGSEKNSDSHSQRGHSSHGRPASASGTASAPPKEALEPLVAGNRDVDHSVHGNVNTWKAENHPYIGDGISACTDNWQQDPQQAQPYANVSMPPCQFDSWHNPPLHPADGPWYRGGTPVGPYRPPGLPGSYFDYPHVPARPLPNSMAVPRPEAGLVGYRPNNSEQYRPHMPPEPYMGPGHFNIPLRPGLYSGLLPFEGYYGPQTGFYGSSEKGPVMPVVRPVIYNQYPTQNPNLDPAKYHPRPGGYATSIYEEQVKLDQAHISQGQFRVLLKQHDGWEGRDADGTCEQSLMGSAPHLDRGNQPGQLRQEGDWRMKKQNPKTAESLSLSHGEMAPSMHTSGLDDHSSDTCAKNYPENSIQAADDRLIRREDSTNSPVRDRKPVMEKNATVMAKGDGLNTKARVSDGHNELGMHSSKHRTKSNDMPITADHTSSEAILVSSKPSDFTGEKNCESTSDDKLIHALSVPRTGENAFRGQKSSHGIKGVDQHAISRSSRYGKDERVKKVIGSESSMTTCASGQAGQRASALDCAASFEAAENHVVPHAASSGDGSYSASSLDTIDIKAQRAKMKEMALQRAKQLQKEEEERTREQKAKALAKLEELNRRTSADSSNQKATHSPPPSNNISKKQLDSGAVAVPIASTFSEAVSAADDEHVIRNAGVSTNVSSDVVAHATDLLQNQVKLVDGTASDAHDMSSKQKQLGYRRRQGATQVRSTREKESCGTSTESPTCTGKVASSASTRDAPVNDEKNNKSNLNPQRTEPSVSVTEVESPGSLTTTAAPADAVSVQSSSEVPAQALTQSTHATVGNHSKPHPPKKSVKKQHTNRSISKYHGGPEATVVWAPVKPPNKTEPPVEASKNSAIDATGPLEKSGNEIRSAVKTKRAEIERYVPKPVAQQNSPSQTQAGKSDSAASSVEQDGLDGSSTVVSSDVGNGVNSKHNKQGEKLASWRQRGPAESPPVGGVREASDHLKPSTVGSIPKGDPTRIDEGWNDVTDVTAVLKDVGANRQRCQPYKTQRVLGSTAYPSDNRNGTDDGKIAKMESESAVGEHPKPHWQPKSKAYNHHGRQGRVPARVTEYNVQNEQTEARSDGKIVELAPEDVNPQHRHQGCYND